MRPFELALFKGGGTLPERVFMSWYRVMYELGVVAGRILTVEIRVPEPGLDRPLETVRLQAGQMQHILFFSGTRTAGALRHVDIPADGDDNPRTRLSAQLRQDFLSRISPFGYFKALRKQPARCLPTNARRQSHIRAITIRVARLTNLINRIFRRESSDPYSPSFQKRRKTVQALDNLYPPLANIANYLDQVRDQRAAASRLTKIHRPMGDDPIEICFYTELLRRYVDDCMRDRDALKYEADTPASRAKVKTAV
ncbi:MAG: hypothetical protein BM562_08380 [Alphaproteobacteria bacterium MedPE-SWcel]|nr:MAG: hypothetical protein BM562_08380 [Alphaproteobacteria bacterium MedPE-SWcel]